MTTDEAWQQFMRALTLERHAPIVREFRSPGLDPVSFMDTPAACARRCRELVTEVADYDLRQSFVKDLRRVS